MFQSADQLSQMFASVKALVIGDLILDTYQHGDVTRISPESPVPIFLQQEGHLSYVAGGAANVAANIASLGGQATLMGVIGKDEPGKVLRELVLGQGVAFSPVSDGRPTTSKLRYVTGSHHLLRVDNEDVTPLSEEMANDFLIDIEEQIKTVHVCVLSDYAKGVLTDYTVPRIIKLAQGYGVPVIVDPKGSDYKRYAGAFLVTPNLKEAQLALGESLVNDELIEAHVPNFAAEHHVDHVLVTRGAEGMSLVSRVGKVNHIRGERVSVFDVVGAGDTVVASLALGVGGKVDILTSCLLANIAASVVVSKAGTATIDVGELFARYNSDLSSDVSVNSIYASTDQLRTLELRCQRLQMEGRSVGLTNGVFDLLHSGHLKVLSAAKKNCDFLVVAINSDQSVKGLDKGLDRPIRSEVERAEMLLALKGVDAVVIFEEHSPLELIVRLRPNLLVKGGDYSRDEVAGASFVEEYGGRVELVEVVKGASTTNLIRDITRGEG